MYINELTVHSKIISTCWRMSALKLVLLLVAFAVISTSVQAGKFMMYVCMMVKPLGSSLFAWMHDDIYNSGYTYSIQQLEVGKGLVFRPCLNCGRKPLTCEDVLNGVQCLSVCVPGCDCPRGTVLDQSTGRCVQDCSIPTDPICPIQGQVFKQCVECPDDPFTCADPVHGCIEICTPGCECPHGQVLDEDAMRCVPLNLCLP